MELNGSFEGIREAGGPVALCRVLFLFYLFYTFVINLSFNI